MRRWWGYSVVAVLSFVLGGLIVFYVWQFVGGGVWRGGVEIRAANLLAPDKLELHVGSCNGTPRVFQLHEDDESIRLRVEASSTPLKDGDDCRDNVKVYLKDPLGDRMIIDDHTNQVVELSEAVR